MENLSLGKLSANAPSFSFNANAAAFEASWMTDDHVEDHVEDCVEDQVVSTPNSEPAVVAPSPTSSAKPNAVRNIERTENMNMVFIGHVDAGKSTVGGQILFLSGCVDKRILEKYEREAKESNRESWYLSWALDLNAEERAKGTTVEVGKAYFTTPVNKKRVTILDAPGHKSYIHNMISGAAQADIGVLVVSARKGEFEAGFDRNGQTREHAMLAKTAGVKYLVVLINKMDDASVAWSWDRYTEITTGLADFLKKTGYSPKQFHFIPVSGQLGINILDPIPAGVFPQWTGLPFLQFLDEMAPLDRMRDAPVRIPVSEKAKDMGTLVYGKLESGELMKGDTLVIMPGELPATIIELGNDEDDDVPSASTGANIRLKLRNVEEEDVHPGYVLCTKDSLVPVVREFDAQVLLMNMDKILCAGLSCVMHIHTAVVEVIVKDLIALLDKKTNKIDKKRPRFVKNADSVIVRLAIINNPVCLETFKDHPQLGRFTLRDQTLTIAVGKVLKIVA